MQDDLNRADLAQRENAAFQSYAVPILRVGERVIAAKALEPWIAGFLLVRLDTTEERLECQINTDLNILQDLAMHQLERRTINFPCGKERLRIVQPKRFLTLLPGCSAGGKRLVIDKTAFLKHSVEDALLAF